MRNKEFLVKNKSRVHQARCLFHTSLTGLLLFAICSCGVKGDPQPPVEPVTLGRGHTDFKTKEEKLNEKRKAYLKKATAE